MNRMVYTILTNFANSFRGLIKSHLIESEHLETTSRNKLSETHSLVLGVLCHSVYQTFGERYVVAVGHGLKSKGLKHRFTPDISLWKINGVRKLAGIMDYESTNSSDSRIFRRNFQNYHHFIQTPQIYNIPEFWVIITTLPSKKVSKTAWYSWDLRRKRIREDEYLKMLENPFRYWVPRYTDEFKKLEEQRVKCPLYVVNLNTEEFRLCLPEAETFSIRWLCETYSRKASI